MQIEENWSEVEAVVVKVQENSALKDFGIVEIIVQTVETVPQFANLMTDTEGQTITIFMPLDIVQRIRLAPHDTIRCHIRKARPDRYFVHRDSVQKL